MSNSDVPANLELQNKIAMLTAKQQSLFLLVQNMYDLSLNVSDDKVKMSFLIRTQSIDSVRKEFIDVSEQLNMSLLMSNPKAVADFSKLLSFDELYCHVKAVGSELATLAISATSPATPTEPTASKFDVLNRRLPALELMSFDGSPNKWGMFYENFSALIHKNPHLSNAEKVQYLIGKLSGKALTVCAGIPPVAHNYEILWNALKEKYEDKRTLATLYLEQILNFKGSQSPSLNSLDAFIENFCSAQAALKQLGIEDLTDFMLTHIALSKLDRETVGLFEQAHRDVKMPTLDLVIKFVKEQSKIYTLRNAGSLKMPTPVTLPNKTQGYSKTLPSHTGKVGVGWATSSYPNKPFKTQSYAANTANTNNDTTHRCPYCKGEHPLFRCEAFFLLNPTPKINFVRNNNLCFNCLGFHNTRSCKSYNRCAICRRMHHTKMHIDGFSYESGTPASSGPVPSHSSSHTPLSAAVAACHFDETQDVSHALADATPPLPASPAPRAPLQPHPQNDVTLAASARNNLSSSIVLLPSATVYAYNQTGECFKIRVFLDSGSMSHFITQSCCDRLNLNVQHAPSTVKGIGLTEKPVNGYTKFTIQSRFDPRSKYTINARVIDSITDKIPSVSVDGQDINHLMDLPLADEDFNKPADIDCLISNELFPFLLGNRKVMSPTSAAVGVQTSLGYVVMGKAMCAIPPTKVEVGDQAFHASVEPTLDSLMQRFWELESVPAKKHLSPEDIACERIFVDTHTRDETGRYIVTLPFSDDPSELGRSDTKAMSQLLRLENKLDAIPELRKDYNQTLQDYIDRGCLSKVENPLPGPCYYIPHHAVYRPEKSTSKTRIVLNASCKTTSGKSLNDILYTGPNLQTNIFDLLLNLRLFKIAISADIEKMFFQVRLCDEHQPFQRIFYRFNVSEPIATYEFSRVSFGLSSSPYLAMRTVRQLAADERDRFPTAARAAERHFYMDDYISSIPSIEEAEGIYRELVDMFNAGGFRLVKWISNSPELMKRIPAHHRASSAIEFDDDAVTKIIGLQWKPKEDTFFFKVNLEASKCTKRIILSTAARFFDPLSLIGPVTALLKLLVQECWKQNLDWDDDVPAYIEKQWTQFQRELHLMENIKIPRHIGIFQNSHHISLIGFADASEVCYGAVIYLRVSRTKLEEGRCMLLCSKSRVAPTKKITLARLELCAALLLSNLLIAVKNSLSDRVVINDIAAFSDSTITLSWINAQPYRFQTFIANRISAITENLSPEHWFHISGNENPADIISRPVMPRELLNNRLWFYGPSWLILSKKQWPVKPFLTEDFLPEEKSVALVEIEENDINENIIHSLGVRCSKWNRYIHTCVYVLRFARILKSRGSISVNDLEVAESYILRSIQQRHFDLSKPFRPALQKLNAFKDENNIIRVGGRLGNSQLTPQQRHPVVLPSKDPVVQLLVNHYHASNLHAGPSLLLAILRQHYWILAGRNLVRKCVQNCNTCFRIKPKNIFPLMGDLPSFRVSEVKSFVFTGVDYAGPFLVTPYRRRGVKSVKAYLCLFICLTTKALHLELVSDLSSEMFLAAFKRFICRRGPVSMIVSDGGTNFLGAKRKLDSLYSLLISEEHNRYLGQNLADFRVQFKTNPPYAPHFGGIWESNIKSVKTHLFKVVGNQVLTYEELNTVLVQIESLMNSRPLSVLSSDPSEPTALTPSHFLNVTPLKYLPAEDLSSIPENRLSRYDLLNRLVQSYWERWRVEYLTTLQVRYKWNTPANPIQLGCIVIIREDKSPPLSWPLGIVEDVYPGKDGIVRTAKVKTKTGSYLRPVVRLCPLPLQ